MNSPVRTEEYITRLNKQLDEERAKRLADAKAAAVASGKEPFDLAKLETMCDTSSEGRVDPVESRRARFEEWSAPANLLPSHIKAQSGHSQSELVTNFIRNVRFRPLGVIRSPGRRAQESTAESLRRLDAPFSC